MQLLLSFALFLLHYCCYILSTVAALICFTYFILFYFIVICALRNWLILPTKLLTCWVIFYRSTHLVQCAILILVFGGKFSCALVSILNKLTSCLFAYIYFRCYMLLTWYHNEQCVQTCWGVCEIKPKFNTIAFEFICSHSSHNRFNVIIIMENLMWPHTRF